MDSIFNFRWVSITSQMPFCLIISCVNLWLRLGEEGKYSLCFKCYCQANICKEMQGKLQVEVFVQLLSHKLMWLSEIEKLIKI